MGETILNHTSIRSCIPSGNSRRRAILGYISISVFPSSFVISYVIHPCTNIAEVSVTTVLFLLDQASGGGSESAGKKKPLSFGSCPSSASDDLLETEIKCAPQRSQTAGARLKVRSCV